MNALRRTALAALLLGLGATTANAATVENPPPEKPPLSSAASAEPAERAASVVPDSVFRKIKRDPLPALPDAGGMAKPGATFPGVGDPLPPLSLPGGPSGGATPALPNLPQGTVGGAAPSMVPVVPTGPTLSATFSGRQPSASVGGKVVRIGSPIKGSELVIREIGDGFVVLSDGTEIEIGETVPSEAKKKPKTKAKGAASNKGEAQ